MTYRRTFALFAAKVALGAALVAGGTGCGGFNLKAVWAVSESTPMQAVVRRADAARSTVNNVERLLSGTAVDDDSKWVPTIALKKADAEAILNAVSADPEYVSPKGKLRIVTAEAWAQALSKLCPSESKSVSLLATISDDVNSKYSDIASQAKTVARFKADIAAEESAIDDKDRESEKADHEAKKKELEEKLEKLQNDYDPKIEAFRSKLKEDAAKASPETKKQLAIALAGLKRAVDDAKLANSVALIGYPKAMPGLKDEVKTIVKRIAADTIENATGTRPNVDKLAPEVKISGGVSVTIAGLDASDIGKLKLDDAIKDIATRSKDYVTHVVTLLGYIKATNDLLELQSNIIDDTMGAISGDPNAGGGDDLGSITIEASPGGVSVAATANTGAGATGKGGNKRMPVPMEACVVAPPPPAAAEGDGDSGSAGGVAVDVAVGVGGKAGKAAKGAKGAKDEKAKPGAKGKAPEKEKPKAPEKKAPEKKKK